jgi:Ca2+-binding EF-hand superfamily protein
MLTDLQRRKLTRYFRVYDLDDDGRLANADFERVVENVRILHDVDAGSAVYCRLRDAYIIRWDALRGFADKDADGSVDLDEWLGYWTELLGSSERYDAEVVAVTDRIFEMFDTDGDGVLGANEFCDFFGMFGLKTAMARQVFIGLDLDGDGAITRDELLEMADQFYRSNDPAAPGNNLFGPY